MSTAAPATSGATPSDAAASSLRTAALVFSAFAALALVLSFGMSPEALPRLDVCSFKALTGLPCPGCGLTRGFCAVSHGRFREATEFNAFSVPLYVVNLGFLAGPLLVRRFPGLASRQAQRRLFRAGTWLAGLLAAYGAWRIAHLW